MLAISSIGSLTSLNLSSCSEIHESGFNYLASMVNLLELSVSHSKQFTNENLQQVCDRLCLLRKIDVSGCGDLSEGMKYLQSLSNLDSLKMKGLQLSDEGFNNIFCLKNLAELDLSHSRDLTDVRMEKISSSLPGLMTLILIFCESLTDKTLESLNYKIFGNYM